MRKQTLFALLAFALWNGSAFGNEADIMRRFGVNGDVASRVATIARGGAVWNETPEERAMALAIGGGTGAERARIATIRRGGAVWGEQPHERAAALMTGGGTGNERSRVETLRRGGSVILATDAERMAARQRDDSDRPRDGRGDQPRRLHPWRSR